MPVSAPLFRSKSSPDQGGDAALPIVIVGAGFSGLGMAIKLREAGIDDFTIVERAGELGGTWRDNRYPGAACDVASHLYSFSFEPNPDWSRVFGRQPEILAYLKACADRHDLRRHIRFHTTIVAGAFDEDAGLWHLQTAAGETLTARVVISAVGALVDPAYPKIAGLKDFQGPVMHTARWDDDRDLSGRRVAVIGSGASAVQLVPELARNAARLSVFQRTPSWIVPRPDRPFSARERARYRRSRGRLACRRLGLYWLNELLAPFVISDLAPFKVVARRLAEAHIRRQVADPALRQRVTPDYRIGCKRILLSNDWYPTLQRHNVALETAGIAQITESAIITADGHTVAVDAIVCATGFKMASAAAPLAVSGCGGRNLRAVWRDGAEAYKGVAVSGFPNLFFLMGPNTGPGHTSVLTFTEQQMRYIRQAILHLRRRRLKFVDVRQEVQDRFNHGLQRRMRYTSWTSGCHSWYLTAAGRNVTLYPGFNWEYRLRLRRFLARDYHQVPLGSRSGRG